MTPPPVQGHQHSADPLIDAERLCAERGERLTPTRRRVLELILARDAPVGAYALLDALRSADGRNAAPPTVYRALDFLLAQGLIHRIESLNAFVACPHACQTHQAQYLICRRCGSASEIADPAIVAAIQAAAAAEHFSVERQSIEITGICRFCQTQAV